MTYEQTHPYFKREFTECLATIERLTGRRLELIPAYEDWKRMAKEYQWGDMSLTTMDFENCMRERIRREGGGT